MIGPVAETDLKARCVALLLLFVALFPSSAAAQDIVKRFRVSVAIEVDGHQGVGSAVWELHMAPTPTTRGDRLYFKSRVLGDAIPIRLDDGREIIVLRRSTHSVPDLGFGGFIVSCALLGAGDVVDRAAEQARIVDSYEGGCMVPAYYKPMVVLAVSNSGVSDLARLSYDDPTLTHIDDLSIFVETTSAPISRGLAENYPWIENLPSAEASYSGPGSVKMDQYYQEDFTLGARK